MTAEIILVPKDKCPMDVLAELGERTTDAWIFIHPTAFYMLKSTCDVFRMSTSLYSLVWRPTENSSQTRLVLFREGFGSWYPVRTIEAEDIAFHHPAGTPEEIFFLKMDN